MKQPFYRYLSMNKFSRSILLATALAILPFLSYAQRNFSIDTTQRFNYNINIETGVYSGFGNTHAYTLVAPTFEYRITPKLTAFGGFSVVNDVNASLYKLNSPKEPNYAPRRNSTRSAAIYGGVVYQPNQHLTLAADAFYMGGHYDPLWNISGSPQPLKAYGFSAEMEYKFNNNNSLHIYFDFIHDETGAFINPYLYDYLGYGVYPSCSPFNLDPMGRHPLF